jgi:hypothetical protein
MRLWAGRPRQWKSGRPAKRAAVLVLTAMLLPLPWHAASPPSVVARETATVAAVVDPFADVVPEALGAAERAADELSAIRLDVALDPNTGAIGGEMSVTWRNPASQPLADVWFRLFPNAF